MKYPVVWFCSLAMLLPVGGTAPPSPVLTAVVPAQGVPGQVLMVEGDHLDGATVVWDAGGGILKRNALQSILSAKYFQIPRDATPGVHPVALQSPDGSSSGTLPVTVSAAEVSWPAPRIEDISINAVSGTGSDWATMRLAISAANVDPDATVFVNDTQLQASFYSAIVSDYFNSHSAKTYGTPVFHYGMLLTGPTSQALGQTITVKVVNRNGAFGVKTYFLPSQDKLDSDNDGLLDDWEDNGYNAPDGTHIDLAAMGCSPHHKDILVEVDWMASALPAAGIWTTIEQVFANAPVLNPDGSQGIAIHIDRGQDRAEGRTGPFTRGGDQLSDHASIDFADCPNVVDHVRFAALKGGWFDVNRKGLFHYCVLANGRPDPSSGRGEIWGDDFFLSFAVSDDAAWQDANAQVGSFLHELGHNLGLHHGGLDNGLADYHECFKWNQQSSMNYRYQMDGFAMDPKDMSAQPPVTHGYSQGMFCTIQETLVDEVMGVSDNIPRHMGDCKGLYISGALNVNTGPMQGVTPLNWNRDETDATDVHLDYDEWGNLKLDFRNSPYWDSEPPPNYEAGADCAKFRWQVNYLRGDSCSSYRIHLDGSASIDVGRCAPPATCGIELPCLPPGTYFASFVCGGNRYYQRTDTDTVSIPNDLTNLKVFTVMKGDSVHLNTMYIR